VSLSTTLCPWLQLTHSALFRDAQAFSQAGSGLVKSSVKYSVTLVDEVFETSVVFDAFFDLVVNLPLEGLVTSPMTLEYTDFQRLSGLLLFMEKWECSQSLRRIVHHNLESLVGTDESMALLIFVLGAYTDSLPLCQSALKDWSRFVQYDHSLLITSNWPLWIWESCPPIYLAAINGAWRNPRCNYHGDEMVNKFVELVKQFKKEKETTSAH
jgi:hypothetical protein